MDMQDAHQPKHQIALGASLFSAAANCLQCHLTSGMDVPDQHWLGAADCPIAQHLPELVQLASQLLQQVQQQVTTTPGQYRAAASQMDAAQLVHFLEVAALVISAAAEQMGHDISSQKPKQKLGKSHTSSNLVCTLDQLLQCQLSLLKSTVVLPQVCLVGCLMRL